MARKMDNNPLDSTMKSTVGSVWADDFAKTFDSGINLGNLNTWFSCAIEAGRLAGLQHWNERYQAVENLQGYWDLVLEYTAEENVTGRFRTIDDCLKVVSKYMGYNHAHIQFIRFDDPDQK